MFAKLFNKSSPQAASHPRARVRQADLDRASRFTMGYHPLHHSHLIAHKACWQLEHCFLACVSSENEIQVWDLEQRRIASSLQWECNITAFSVIYGTNYMYIGSEYAIVSVLKLLIAYENGLIVLWDASEDRVVLVRGSKDLKVKEKNELSDATEESKQVEKEISSLCWVSDNGSILAVGYVDGDIMFWDLSTAASTKDQKSEESDNNVAKLQLSSGDRRLPVIVLHWSANRLHKHHRGQLFVYGGDEIGSQEVLTVLSLDWSSGIESLTCISRTDLTLNGSFADMALLPTDAAMESSDTLLFILTNQGQLQVNDKACLSALMSQQQEKTAVPAVQYPMFIPTIEPYMTVAKLALVNTDKECSSALSKWPLTGGVPSQLNDADNYHVERVYLAGYQDGSVRIWDATYPALSLICVLGSEVKAIRSTVASATVSALDFCSVSLHLAVGDECDNRGSDETRLHFVTTTETEVHDLQQGKGPQCVAVFSILDSPICVLQFANFGGRLAVGFECGRVAMLDISTLSVLFLTDSVSNSSSPVICLAMKSFSDTGSSLQSPENSESKNLGDPGNGLTFIMTRNGHIVVIDSSSGNMISSWPMHSQKESTAVSMHLIEDGDVLCHVLSEKHSLEVSPRNEAKSDHAQTSADSASTQLDVEPDTSRETAYFAQRLLNVCFTLL
ncbi:lethal(2) giant larvae protein homolog SRO77-like isoform X1 [Prunus yedoensis var. nudiflora]|uniref:Lethal(2) giant larvae protein homolog SRO77-like isoform X1 n=1 Tax=Prunus yedoensis var. nudiflora TaxID=2094558 RepID=A0A314Z7G7_PRUYE|nr:lethal(2) giant larvae protein homolog SRO77-like isoform X1 [Prunus yedoensis var. nudiflora]